MKILVAFGTRPEYIKLSPLMKAFATNNIAYETFFTGQHLDLLPAGIQDSVSHRLEIKEAPNRLDSIVGSVMQGSKAWEDPDLTHVIIQGDTTSAFAVALAAFHRKIKVIHLEAGLRTHNKYDPYPEEFNRQSIARLTDIHLCPTAGAAENLRQEKVGGSIHVVGNTVLDNLRGIETCYDNKILITMHRRENHLLIEDWFTEFESLAKDHPEYEFVFPIHPNPNVRKHRGMLKHVKVIEPLQYNEFIHSLASCRFVITDSGGIQEESSFFNKRCIICRKTTERVEGLGNFAFLCDSPSRLRGFFQQVNHNHVPRGRCPYGDGYATDKIVEVLTG